MRIGLSLGIASNVGGGVQGPTLTTSPVISGDPTVEANTLTLDTSPVWADADSSSWVWTRNGTEISGSTNGTTIVVQSGENVDDYRVKATGTNDSGTTIRYSNPLAGLQAPSASGSLSDRVFTYGTGDQDYDASTVFTGSQITYSVSGAGATINSSTGVVTHTTDASVVEATIIVTAANAAGSVQRGYEVTVNAVAPTVSDSDQTISSGSSMDVDLSAFVTNDGGDDSITYAATGAGISSVNTSSGIVTMIDSLGVTTVTWSATNSGGTNSGNTFDVTISAGIVAPSFDVPNITRSHDGVMTVDLSTYMTNDGGDAAISYSLTPKSGVSLAGPILTFSDVVQTYSAVAVAATNTGGATNDTFDFTVSAIEPSMFAPGDWSVTGADVSAVVTLTTLPDDGGSAITAIEYLVSGGSWTDSGRTTTGDFTISGLTNGVATSVAIRAVNAVGNGGMSATKGVTANVGGYSLTDNIAGASISIADVGGGNFEFTVTGDADYTGVYTVTQTALDTGLPICIVDPVTSFSDPTFTAVEGLWIYPTDDQPVIEQEWLVESIVSDTGTTYDRGAGEETILIEYRETATNIEGVVEATATAQEVVSFTETGVSIAGGAMGRAGGFSNEVSKDAVWFMSFTMPMIAGQQYVFRGWPNQIESSNTSFTVGFRFDGNTWGPQVTGLTPGDRINMLLSCEQSNQKLYVKVNSGAWALESSNTQDRTWDGDYATHIGIGGRNNTTYHGNIFTGEIFRVAMFSSAYADASLAATQDVFANADGSLRDPAASYALLGKTAEIDVYGPPSDWDAGTNHGTMPDFTLIDGTFT